MINKISDNLASLKSNGVKVVTSSTRPSNAVDGQVIYEVDTDSLLVYNNSSWVKFFGGSERAHPLAYQ